MSRYPNRLNELRGHRQHPIGWLKLATWVYLMVVGVATASAQVPERYTGIGRVATPAEIAAWDIDVRPDFKGLPKGSGSVAQGADIWEQKCASCHGIFGESNEVFNPLVGGTTAQDVTTGRVARLLDPAYPSRTTLMKVPTLSTLWDYINRAMPWNQPKSLAPNEVYAVLAYMLNLGNIVPDNYVLSDQNMVATQARLPNRNGMTTRHALWPGMELGGTKTPDIQAIACMRNCPVEAKISSLLPDYARNAHGNLADQNRPVGAQKGANTNGPTAQNKAPPASAGGGGWAPPPAAVQALLTQHSCLACHGLQQKLVGPAFSDIAKKYPGQASYLSDRIKSGGVGVWGSIPMPAQTLEVEQIKPIADWLAGGAGS